MTILDYWRGSLFYFIFGVMVGVLLRIKFNIYRRMFMPRWMHFPKKARRSGKKMVYVHGEQHWAFRVMRDKDLNVLDVTLVQILSSAPKIGSWSDGTTFRSTIVQCTQAQRKAGRKPAVNMNRFDVLMAVDGLPGKHAGSVARVFEEAFRLGLSVGEGDISARQTKSLNDYTRELMALLKPSRLFNEDETPICQTLQSVYRLGIWAAEVK